jgi:hypothetical protein
MRWHATSRQPRAKKMTRRRESKLPQPEAAAEDVENSAPRLIKVAAHTSIAFGLFDGANRARREFEDLSEDASHVAFAGYRSDALPMTVVRIASLLDSDPKVISFQRMYRHLKRPEVVDALVRRACSRSWLAEESNIRDAVERFLTAYRGIDWRDLHGRLQQFRNRGVAHLTPEEIDKRVTYAEIGSLVHSISLLAEFLTPFCPNGVAVRADEIAEWSDRAKSVWDVMLRNLRKDEGGQ